jgi:GntR family transcriptional regulator, carbon starvation induced regulator
MLARISNIDIFSIMTLLQSPAMAKDARGRSGPATRPAAATTAEPAQAESPRTLAGATLGRLRADVLRGHLRPGTRLRFHDLRRSYGVGLSPLREALSRLAADGLVRLQEQRGFEVAPVSLDDLWDVHDVRRGLEVMALRESIARGDDRWEADVVASFHRLAKTHAGGQAHPALRGDEWERWHRAFHLALLAACGSPWLLHLRNILFDHAERYRQLSARAYSPRASLREHRELMEATLARDAKRACALLERHMRRTAESVARHARVFHPQTPREARR